MQLDGQGRDRAGRLLRLGGAVLVAAMGHRLDDLLDQRELTIGGQAERAQVSGAVAELGHLRGDAGDLQCCGVVVGGAGRLDDQPEGLELAQDLVGDAGLLQQLLARQAQLLALGNEILRRGIGVRGHERPRRGVRGTQGRGLQAPVDRVEVLADDLQGQVVVALHPKHVAQSLGVGAGELPVARGGPLRLDEVLGLQVADLGDADVREVRAQQVQDLPDAQQPIRRCSRAHDWPPPTRNTNRYLPIWTSSPPARSVASIRSRLT